MTTVAIWHCKLLKQNKTICFLGAVQREMFSTGSCFHLEIAQWLDKWAEAAYAEDDRVVGGESTHPWRMLSTMSFPGRFWRQVGGHLRLIESNSRGVVWGIGHDHTAWLYTGGYGGGFIQGTAWQGEMQSSVDDGILNVMSLSFSFTLIHIAYSSQDWPVVLITFTHSQMWNVFTSMRTNGGTLSLDTAAGY